MHNPLTNSSCFSLRVVDTILYFNKCVHNIFSVRLWISHFVATVKMWQIEAKFCCLYTCATGTRNSVLTTWYRTAKTCLAVWNESLQASSESDLDRETIEWTGLAEFSRMHRQKSRNVWKMISLQDITEGRTPRIRTWEININWMNNITSWTGCPRTTHSKERKFYAENAEKNGERLSMIQPTIESKRVKDRTAETDKQFASSSSHQNLHDVHWWRVLHFLLRLLSCRLYVKLYWWLGKMVALLSAAMCS